MTETRTRVRNWDIRLVEWCDDVQGEPFEWGATDCASLVAGALEAMYDQDLVGDTLPSYDSEEEAREAHEDTGGPSTVLRALGCEEIALNFARQGDVIIGVGEEAGMEGCAVVVASEFVVASEKRGVERRPLRALRRAAPEGVTVLRPPE